MLGSTPKVALPRSRDTGGRNLGIPVSQRTPITTSTINGSQLQAAAIDDVEALGDAVDLAIRGESRGWDLLFDRFYVDIHRYAAARLGDRDAAEEVSQEVFLAAIHSIGKLRDRRNAAVEAWFFRIARHKVTDHIRKAVRDRRRPATSPEADGDPAAVALQRADVGRLRAALGRLTESQRDLVIRRFVLDQSLDQVASVMSRPVGAIKSMQHRALAQLAKHLREDV